MRPNYLSMLRTILGIALIAMTATAASAEDFYKGKTLRIVVGSAPGGGFDAYARLMGRHLGKHIPGAPRTLVANMTGAGNLIAANYMYNKAKPDGLTIGHWVGTLVLQQVLGNKRVQFDARKFEWITVPKPSYTAWRRGQGQRHHQHGPVARGEAAAQAGRHGAREHHLGHPPAGGRHHGGAAQAGGGLRRGRQGPSGHREAGGLRRPAGVPTSSSRTGRRESPGS